MSRVLVEGVLSPARLYRFGSPTGEGLWYDKAGRETLLASASGIAAAVLPMSPHPVFSEGGFQWISAADSMATLCKWFSLEEMIVLAYEGYKVEVVDVKAYRRLAFTDYGYSHEVYRAEDVERKRFVAPEDFAINGGIIL